ncbi:MAG: PqqD family protein [Mariprofundaceae bacterium]
MREEMSKTATSKKRFEQVLAAIDAIAAEDRLAFLTTQQVSRKSRISDGVLFRHFCSKEAMLSAWLTRRGARLRSLLDGAPAGKPGLIYMIGKILDDHVLLTLICCQPMDTPYLQRELAQLRDQLHRLFTIKIELLVDAPLGVEAAVLTDHLIQSLQRAWNPNNTHRQQYKEKLMTQLPWEKSTEQTGLFPNDEIIQRLALNESGFVFDPINGLSFTANDTGLFILRSLQQKREMVDLQALISEHFSVDASTSERDIVEFAGQLRKLLS